MCVPSPGRDVETAPTERPVHATLVAVAKGPKRSAVAARAEPSPCTVAATRAWAPTDSDAGTGASDSDCGPRTAAGALATMTRRTPPSATAAWPVRSAPRTRSRCSGTCLTRATTVRQPARGAASRTSARPSSPVTASTGPAAGADPPPF